MKTPLVSIVTVVFRDRDELERILRNVFTFDPTDFEMVVIDGGSKDGTLELLQEWDEKVDYWLSEPDSGIYDAMNKGIAAARGEYVLHLNAGDTLKSVPVEALSVCLHNGVDVAVFAVTTDRGETFFPQTGFRLRLGNTWHHQGTFYRRTPELLYDTKYRVYGDFDLNQRLLKSGKAVRLFRQVVAHHLRDGISEDRTKYGEAYRVIRGNFGLSHVVLAYLRIPYHALRRGLKRVCMYSLAHIRKSAAKR